MTRQELPLLCFRSAAEFEDWLAENADASAGAWLRFAKAGGSGGTLSKSDAIDSALAYGWVDGQLGRVDEHFYKVRFTPRGARSAWSQLNRERAERLMSLGRMGARGLMEVERARADGRWAAAYAPQARATPDPDLLAALDAAPPARAAFDGLDAANRYAILYRVQRARPEKRAAKIAELVTRLREGRLFHP